MANKRISELTEATEILGIEYVEILQNGINKKALTALLGIGTTRESDRAADSELLFDKNIIQMLPLVQSGSLEITVAEIGNLSGQESVIEMEIQHDGVNTITFTGFDYFSNVAQGDILEAGTYQVFFLRLMNGRLTVSYVKPSYEVSNLIPLSVPGSFAAVPGTDPETEIDLSWAAVANVSGYEIYRSLSGVDGSWGTAIATPAAGDTTYTDTGRTPGTTYYYRIRAIGVFPFSNSNYSTAVTSTEDSADMTAPTFTFSPVDTAVDIDVNGVMVITASAPLIDQDGTTVITDANLTDYITAVNSTAVAQPFTATIDATKTIITITPDVVWTELDDITISIDGVQSSVNGVHAVADDATFTTSDFTMMAGNYVLEAGAELNAVLQAVDAIWEIKATIKNHPMASQRSFAQIWGSADANKSFIIRSNGDDFEFLFYDLDAGSGNALRVRTITWPNVITSGEHTYEFQYKGDVDTSNGLNRGFLYKDAVLVTAGKTVSDAGAPLYWPFNMSPNSEPAKLNGSSIGQVKDIIVTANNGATTELNIPIVRTGIDVSGNDRHCTWV